MQIDSITLAREAYWLGEKLRPGCPASLYLASIGLRPEPCMRLLPRAGEVLGFKEQFYHGLMLPTRDVDGRQVGVVFTWLLDNGWPHPAKETWPRVWSALGEFVPVHFGEPDDALAWTLRWEDALAIRQKFSMPCWAAVWPWRLGSLPMPASVSRVILYGGGLDRARDHPNVAWKPSESDAWADALERRGYRVECVPEGINGIG